MIRYKSVKIGLLFSLVFLVLPLVSWAATAGDTFNVSVFMGTDSVPPSIPGNFSVTPIATDQIDLDWDASSDNLSVSGYQVFRDAVQIATTTLTAYSDTSLSASTLYSYYVTAFDASLNISTSTATLSTTTLAVVSTTTPTTTPNQGSQAIGSYGGVDIALSNLTINATENSAQVSFDTNVYTKAVVRWGRGDIYENGFIASETFKKNHQTRIDGLEAGVVYDLEIFLVDNYGQEELSFKTTFKTLTPPDNEPPQNVSFLQASLSEAIAQLSWQNPEIDDFSRVRVLSSDYFYPAHTADGWLVYEGDGEAVTDDRPLQPGQARYYTVFVYDETDNISSGSVVKVIYQADGRVVDELPITDEPVFKFSDLRFFQDGREVEMVDGKVQLRADRETKITLPYEILPEHLKTIVVTFADPEQPDAVFSFLLRVDKDKNNYTALIGPIDKGGIYPVALEVFDFKTQELSKVRGEALVVGVLLDDRRGSVIFEQMSIFHWGIAAGLGLLLLLAIFFASWRLGRRREDKSL